PLAQRPFRSLVQTGGPDGGQPATIFASCLVDRIMPEAGQALNPILSEGGFRGGFPDNQWWCGVVLSNDGAFARGGRLFARLVSALEASEGPIVTPSASCFGAATIDSADWGVGGAGVDSVRERLRDSTRFVLELLEARPSLVRAASGLRPRV